MKVSADYRMLTLDALRGKWKTAVLTGIAASALGATIVSSSNSVVSNSNQAKDIHFDLFAQPNGGRLLAVLLAGIGLWAIFTLIVCGAARLGYARFNLNLVDGKDAAISDLFSQKDRLWDGFCMNFLQGLYTALWTLLLVIPGIVKTYSYAMTPYIMAEHPSLTANEAITESRRIMDGNKWRLVWPVFPLAAVLSGFQLHWLGVALCAATVCRVFSDSQIFLRVRGYGDFSCSSSDNSIEHWLLFRVSL